MFVLIALILFIKYSISLPLQEIFTLDCQRRAHFFPTLPYATGVDFSGHLSILNAAFNEMYEQSKVICPDISDEEFNNRFMITLPQGLVRLFELEKFPPNECEDRYYQEISTYYHYIKDLLPPDPLPYSCSQEAADEGRCHFAIELSAFTLQIAIEECPTYPGEDINNRVPFLSITCEGCDTFLKPCTDNMDCGDDMLCELYEDSYSRFYAWFKGTTLGGELVLNEEDFFNFGWFDDLLQKSLTGYEFVTEFFHSVAWNYWGSGFVGNYDAYKFCFPDIAYGSDMFLGMYSIEKCDESNVTTDWYCGTKVFTDPAVCGGVGDCVESDICVCPEGWTGDLCENEEVHIYCYGVYSEKLTEVCSTHGTCVEEDVCLCYDGWMGDECERVAQCNGYDYFQTESCGVHGTCVEDGVCECDAFWYTADENLPCAGELRCGIAPNYFPTGYGCSWNGECVFADNGDIGVCECFYGYDGPNCFDNLECDGVDHSSSQVCGGLGNCTMDGTCDCVDGVKGDFCQFDERKCGVWWWYETDRVCNNQGTCEYNPESDEYECVCNEGHYTSLPGLPDCKGDVTCNLIPWDMESVCSGNGQCTEQDTCVCDTYYTGATCTEPILCNWVFGGSPDVCSGSGICTIDGNCVCDENHYGVDCEYSVECDGLPPYDPNVCGGTGVCTVEGCEYVAELWYPDPVVGKANEDCTKQLLHIVAPWEGNMANNDMVNSPSRKSGQYFYTQINRVRMEYDPEKPIPVFIYNGDGVFTFLPTHNYFGFAVYLKDFDRLLVLLDELFLTLREMHTDVVDVLQEYYFKVWDLLPWLFRFTSYNLDNHLNWRVNHWDKYIVRFLGGYRLPKWFKLIEPPMTCTLQSYRDGGNCTLRFTSLRQFFGKDFDLYLRIRRDAKNSVTDYTGFPHMEVWCGGVLCHEMYNLKRCEDNTDCESEHCKVWAQTTDYRLDTFVTPVPVFEVIEEDGTTFTFDAMSLNALFFEGGLLRMDYTSDELHPLSFFKKLHAKVTGIDFVEDMEEDLNFCMLNRKENMRVRRGKYKWWYGNFWEKLQSFWDGLVRFESVDDWWQNHWKWWKNGGKWWKNNDKDDDDDWDFDDDKDDDDDFDTRRGWWKDWWKKKLEKWIDRTYVTKIKGLEAWSNLFCMKAGGDECGCDVGMINCVCYEYVEENCEDYFYTPQENIEVLPGIEYVPPIPDPDDNDDDTDDSVDDDGDGDGDGDDDGDGIQDGTNPSSAAVLVVTGLVFVLALVF